MAVAGVTLGSGAGVEQRQVDHAVEVEVAGQGTGGAAGCVESPRPARVFGVAAALPLQEEPRRLRAAQEQQVLAAVLIEVGADHPVTIAGGGQLGVALAGLAVAADAVVEEDLVRRAAVQDQQVEVAVVIEVDQGDRHAGAVATVEARLGGDFDEAAVAVVAPERVRSAVTSLASAARRAEAGHQQVEVAVMVGVGPGGPDAGPGLAGDPGVVGDVLEAAGAVVAVEPVRTIAAQEQVRVAVLVIIAEGSGDRARGVDAAIGHRREAAAVVAVEDAAIAAPRQEEVEIPVAVHVGHRRARPYGVGAGRELGARPTRRAAPAADFPSAALTVLSCPEAGLGSAVAELRARRLRRLGRERRVLEVADDAGVAAHLAVLHAGDLAGLGLLQGPEAIQQLARPLGLPLLAQQPRQPIAGRLVMRPPLQGRLEVDPSRRLVGLQRQDAELVAGVRVPGVGLEDPLEQLPGPLAPPFVAQQHGQRIERVRVARLALDHPAQLLLGAPP